MKKVKLVDWLFVLGCFIAVLTTFLVLFGSSASAEFYYNETSNSGYYTTYWDGYSDEDCQSPDNAVDNDTNTCASFGNIDEYILIDDFNISSFDYSNYSIKGVYLKFKTFGDDRTAFNASVCAYWGLGVSTEKYYVPQGVVTSSWIDISNWSCMPDYWNFTFYTVNNWLSYKFNYNSGNKATVRLYESWINITLYKHNISNDPSPKFYPDSGWRLCSHNNSIDVNKEDILFTFNGTGEYNYSYVIDPDSESHQWVDPNWYNWTTSNGMYNPLENNDIVKGSEGFWVYFYNLTCAINQSDGCTGGDTDETMNNTDIVNLSLNNNSWVNVNWTSWFNDSGSDTLETSLFVFTQYINNTGGSGCSGIVWVNGTNSNLSWNVSVDKSDDSNTTNFTINDDNWLFMSGLTLEGDMFLFSLWLFMAFLIVDTKKRDPLIYLISLIFVTLIAVENFDTSTMLHDSTFLILSLALSGYGIYKIVK